MPHSTADTDHIQFDINSTTHPFIDGPLGTRSCIDWCALELQNIAVQVQYHDVWMLVVAFLSIGGFIISYESEYQHKWYIDRLLLYTGLLSVLVFIIRNVPEGWLW